MDGKSVLDELYTDAGPFDEAAAVQALKPLVAIQRDSQRIFVKSDRKLSVEGKILAYALAKKLLKMEGRIEGEFISAAEINEATGIKKGSIDPTFKRLRVDGVLVGSGTRYELPQYKVSDVIALLNSATEKSK